jgi:uncharacterized lipoprotein YbaY
MKLKVGSQAFVLDVQNQLVKQGIVIAENKQKTIDKVHVTYDIQFDDNKIEREFAVKIKSEFLLSD